MHDTPPFLVNWDRTALDATTSACIGGFRCWSRSALPLLDLPGGFLLREEAPRREPSSALLASVKQGTTNRHTTAVMRWWRRI